MILSFIFKKWAIPLRGPRANSDKSAIYKGCTGCTQVFASQTTKSKADTMIGAPRPYLRFKLLSP